MTDIEIDKMTRSVQSIKGVDWMVSGKPTLEELSTHSCIRGVSGATLAENGLGGVSSEAMELMKVAMASLSPASVQAAVEAGWPVNAVCTFEGKSLLNAASHLISPHLEATVATLIDLGADPHQKVSVGKSDISTGKPRADVVRLSPFNRMILNQNDRCLDIMAKAHAGGLLSSPQSHAVDARTSGNIVVQAGSVHAMEVMQALFERDIRPAFPELEINHIWLQKRGSLDNRSNFVHSYGNPKGMAWLLDHPKLGMKTHIDVEEPGGRTPLWIAAENGFPDAARVLISRGAKADLYIADGGDIVHCMKKRVSMLDRSGSDSTGQAQCLEHIEAAIASQRAARAIDDVMERSARAGKDSKWGLP